jgi:hypothetical protein
VQGTVISYELQKKAPDLEVRGSHEKNGKS